MTEDIDFAPKSAWTPSLTSRDLLSILFRQKRVALVSFGTVLVAVLIYGLTIPGYQAKMKVLVRKGRVDPVVTPTPTASSQFERQEVTEEELNSEAELLRDEQILGTVVREASLVEARPAWRFWEGYDAAVDQERAVRRLGKRLAVEPLRKTNLIAVTYDSSDPAKASQVLQCLAKAYLERHQQVHRPSGESSFFEQQMQEAQRGLEQAELRMIEFGRRRGVVSAELERDLTLQKLNDADASEHQTRVLIEESQRRVRALQEAFDSTPERSTTQIKTADNPQLLEKMKSRLLELLLKRAELTTRFQPTYKLVQEVDGEIAETRNAIAAEELSPVKDETTDQDVTHEWARAELAKGHVELSALEARAQATQIMRSSYRQTAQRLGDGAILQEQLRRNLKAAEEKYLLYANKREEARIGDALDQGGILNVTIAEQPSAPALPAHSRVTLAFLGFLLATAISTGMAFTTDYLDPAFRTPDEVVAYLGAPVLASLPRKLGESR